METTFRAFLVAFISRFKSYYVVWKHDMVANKSISNFLFKSYYVVWKQKEKTTQENKKKGLNRTM